MAVSLRRRLILILLALTLLAWLVMAVITALLAQQLIVRQVERQLNQYMDMAQHSMGVIFSDPQLADYYRRMAPQVYKRDAPTHAQGFNGGHGCFFSLYSGGLSDTRPVYKRHTAGTRTQGRRWPST